MRLVRQTKQLATVLSGSVLTIGNFDGLHLGHQAMLAQASEEAQSRHLPLVVMSFDPHPEEFFLGDNAPARLMDSTDRVLAMATMGVDILCLLPFNAQLAETTATQFVEQVLLADLHTECVVVGDDFCYGKGREGSYESLKLEGEQNGFDVMQLDTISDEHARYSSTRLRSYLGAGDFEHAQQLLGRPYRISGRVIHGDARGRIWGFPTLNLKVKRKKPLSGVFVVTVTFFDGTTCNGVANLGVRPTVGGNKRLLEVNLFNFQGDLYGERVCVDFYHQIRPEQRFDSFDALKKQISQDKQQALAWFQDHQGQFSIQGNKYEQ